MALHSACTHGFPRSSDKLNGVTVNGGNAVDEDLILYAVNTCVYPADALELAVCVTRVRTIGAVIFRNDTPRACECSSRRVHDVDGIDANEGIMISLDMTHIRRTAVFITTRKRACGTTTCGARASPLSGGQRLTRGARTDTSETVAHKGNGTLHAFI